METAPIQKIEQDQAAGAEAESKSKEKQKLVYASCDMSIPYNVAKFCWFNKAKFDGNIYCVECQKKV